MNPPSYAHLNFDKVAKNIQKIACSTNVDGNSGYLPVVN
jgi:hypothetical protein